VTCKLHSSDSRDKRRSDSYRIATGEETGDVHIAANVKFESGVEVDARLFKTTKSAISFPLEKELVEQQQALQHALRVGRHAAYVLPLQRAVRVRAPARQAIVQISTEKKRRVVAAAAAKEVLHRLPVVRVPGGS
jgi:hypothetical protein